ncbi:MAG TPA: KpsF/GutQ family sugar-phosphate isomerase [Rhabdochlamydiaceae bacterium]|nr:KpsF/GutQ family sugar-phosphate isomerase [Rhabdochlamydiaceae bacterium]
MLREIFTDQRKHLEYFFDHLDEKQAEAVFNLCAGIKGFLVLSGVGKSGLVAEKIAMTLVSTGTKALYLPSLNFLHGDIGIISSDDCVLLLSKSGETEELLSLVPFIRKKGAKLIALVSNMSSRLAQMADVALSLPVEKELCPFDLAPTISTEVQLLFGDVLSMALMKHKGFTLASYGENHPSGTIGKKTTIKVGQIMIHGQALPICQPAQKLLDVLPEFSSKRLGCLLVVDPQGKFQGIYTDGDLRRSLQAFGSDVMHKAIEELMTRRPISTQVDVLAWDALKLMQKDPKRWIMVLPVLEKEKVVGLIRMHDIIHTGIA